MGIPRRLVPAALAAVCFAGPAAAHHSHAMFDMQKTMVLEGTVKQFEWTNPHTWIEVMVTDARGAAVQWSLELGSPAQISRIGWRPKTLSPGDKVTVSMHPLKDGNAGGALITVKLPNGETIGGEND
jgi:hypothetical protein